LAAIHGQADYLQTGDARHFDHLYGKRIEGVLVIAAQLLERSATPLKAPVSPHSFGGSID